MNNNVKFQLQVARRKIDAAMDEAENVGEKWLAFYDIHKGPLWGAFTIGFTAAYLLAAAFGVG